MIFTILLHLCAILNVFYWTLLRSFWDNVEIWVSYSGGLHLSYSRLPIVKTSGSCYTLICVFMLNCWYHSLQSLTLCNDLHPFGTISTRSMWHWTQAATFLSHMASYLSVLSDSVNEFADK